MQDRLSQPPIASKYQKPQSLRLHTKMMLAQLDCRRDGMIVDQTITLVSIEARFHRICGIGYKMHVVTRIRLFHQPQDVERDFADISQTREVVTTMESRKEQA